MSQALKGAEVRCQLLEKVTLTLLTTARRLRRYFKAQVLADFLVEMTEEESALLEIIWTVHVDGSSNKKRGRAGIVLQSNMRMIVEKSLRFGFPATNKQAEYEARITGLITAQDLRAKEILVCCDSMLVVSQANDDAQVRDSILKQYLARVRQLMLNFDKVEFHHVPRLQND